VNSTRWEDASGSVLPARVAAGDEAPNVELLLPEVVAAMATDRVGLPVNVRSTDAALIDATHAADLPVVSAELSRQVARGIRPRSLRGTGA